MSNFLCRNMGGCAVPGKAYAILREKGWKPHCWVRDPEADLKLGLKFDIWSCSKGKIWCVEFDCRESVLICPTAK